MSIGPKFALFIQEILIEAARIADQNFSQPARVDPIHHLIKLGSLRQDRFGLTAAILHPRDATSAAR